VVEEIMRIKSIVREENVQYLIGEQVTEEAVKLQIQDCSWIHIAGHGQQDKTNPLKSHIGLHKGTLELGTILQMDLSSAEFIFLSICDTFREITGGSDMGEVFIAAGFQGVVGTMWVMKDDDGPRVAKTFYTYLCANDGKPQARDAAKALQLAVREMRDNNVSNMHWVPFIHKGI
jgi:CHAT domain-containing protein